MIRARAAFGSVMLFLGFSSIAAILWFGGRQVIMGNMTVGMITSFIIYGFLIAAGLGNLAGLYGEFRAVTGAVRRSGRHGGAGACRMGGAAANGWAGARGGPVRLPRPPRPRKHGR